MSPTPKRVTGWVKWFEADKGYGMIGTGDGTDVLLHYSMIDMDGFKTVREGDEVMFTLVAGPTGPAASGVKVVNLPVEDLPRSRGTVESFDDSEGSGIILCEDGSALYLHYSHISMNGHKSLQAGDLVEFSVKSDRGRRLASHVVRLGTTDPSTG